MIMIITIAILLMVKTICWKLKCLDKSIGFSHFRMVPSFICRQLGCSQGCQVTGTGRAVCSCMEGFRVQNDGITCEGEAI